MNDFRRRDFLRWSAASLTALGLGSMPPFLRRAMAGELAGERKLLFIFLRGGIDAVQTVIPYGDAGIPSRGISTYLDARPTLGVDPNLAHDLNDFVSLHPDMQDDSPDGPRLADMARGSLDGRGKHLAILHRVGYASQNRSHFSSQQFWENGVPGSAVEEGVFNRWLSAYYQDGNPLQAVTLGKNQMVAMKGSTLIPVLRKIDDYSLPANVPLGSSPGPGDPLGSFLRGAYGQRGFDPGVPSEALAYSTGSALLESLEFFEQHVRATPYSPAPEAASRYEAMSDRLLAGYIQDCARILKQVPGCRIVGANMTGFDTHGGENAVFPRLARDLALILTALFYDLEPIWENTLVITLSEFGRTSAENGNRGTDHGEATCIFCMGGRVKGGVYNADPSTWSHGDLFSSLGRYVAHRTDYRAVYAELIRKHLGDPATWIDGIIPGYSELEENDRNGYFSPLGFLK
jgi:uncharacterized protein (DUF1501 family)